MLCHLFSNVPTAHAPMFESRDIENLETGIVEPRMSAEAVSVSFLQCILKGLHRSPEIVCDEALFARPDVFSVEDVSCLVIPDGCLGLPTLAALEQGIHVIAVRENRNLMRNDLTLLPWAQRTVHPGEQLRRGRWCNECSQGRRNARVRASAHLRHQSANGGTNYRQIRIQESHCTLVGHALASAASRRLVQEVILPRAKKSPPEPGTD